MIMNLEKRILVIEDEVKLVEVIESYLLHSGYAVCKAYNGKDALTALNQFDPHLIILDLMLPDISGEEICKYIRRFSRVPIIILTAKVSEDDILNGLDIGADDFVTKPFSPKQLVARVGAILRRTSEERSMLSHKLSFNNDDLVIHIPSHEVFKNGEIVKLTPHEYNILLSLIKYCEKTFTREELISVALDHDFDGYDRVIDSHIKNLRQKIETDPKNPKYILTVFGVGYRFDAKQQGVNL